MFQLAEWMPDQPDLSQAGREAKNCVWLEGRYQGLQDKTAATGAFSGACRGAYAFIRVGSNTKVYAGTPSDIFELDGASWTSRSSSHALGATDRWEFCQFGSDVIAATLTEDLRIQTGGSGSFSAISGAPKAAAVWALRNFVMCGDIGGVSPVPYRIRWSAINDGSDWPTPGSTDAQIKQAGEQDMRAQSGRVMAIRGSDFAIIFQEEAITRATYVGGALVWQFDPIDEQRGLIAPRSAVQVGRVVYFLAKDGFYATDGSGASQAIGYGKVDRWFFNELNATNIHRVTGAHDPERQVIIWSFPSTSSDGTPDREIIYNYAEQRWTNADVGMEVVFSAAAVGVTLDGLDAFSTDLDALGASLDSPEWIGGGGYLGAISGGRLYSFDGDPLDAVIDTGEFQAEAGRRSFLTQVRPESDGTVTVQVGHRKGSSDPVTWTAVSAVNADSGWAPFRVNNFYMRVRLNISGGFEKAVGVHVDVRPSGYR